MSDEAPRLTWGERLSDVVNPLLVRETQQVLGSKAFVVVMSVALAAICGVAFTIAAQGTGPATGRDAFTGALVVLAPILTFLIPLQAFIAMQQELRAVSSGLALHRRTDRTEYPNIAAVCRFYESCGSLEKRPRIVSFVG